MADGVVKLGTLGQGRLGGTFVDSHDHLWVTTRPRSLDDHDKYAAANKADCCVAPPPILEFDQAGNVVQGWGGPAPGYEWPDLEHGIFVDYKENVWVTGNGGPDGSNKKVQILNRDTLEVVGFFGGYGGHGAGQFFHVHSIASDSKGNIYLGESFGARVLRWALK